MKAVELKGITKRFPGTVANNTIDFTAYTGEIHALLGENGAGKSTLMSILYGLYQPDEGQIFIKGNEENIEGPQVANSLGIGMVHQHFMLIRSFTVLENIILGNESVHKGLLDYKNAEQEILRLSNFYGLEVDPSAKIEDISVGMQQRVEILKALYRGADILIFDEPTAVLTPQEIDELIEIMRNMIDEGKTIIFITHKLEEIMKSCHRVTVIRRGELVAELMVSDTSEEKLATLMVGREVASTVNKETHLSSRTVLEVNDLTVYDDRGVCVLNQLELKVRAGEILGIAGVDGNGQAELVEVITGLKPFASGSIWLNEVDISQYTPREIIQRGVGHIPEDRHRRGLVLDFTVAENCVLHAYREPPFSSGFHICQREVMRYAEDLMSQYDIRTSGPNVPVRALSGGNQQKIIIAREIDRNPDLLLAVQPTRGLDIGAIEFVHQRLLEQRNKGKAILLVSLELEEIVKLSDRVLVIHKGEISGSVNPQTVTSQGLGMLMAGEKEEIDGGLCKNQ